MKKLNVKLIFKKFKLWFVNIGSDADNDWKLILSISILVFVFLVFYNLQIFFAVQNQKETGASTQAKSSGFVDAKNLANVLGKYNIRAKAYSDLLATTTPFIDPSL